ncbi:MAG: winged helix-turn-helix transcriptional regulator, partial [Thermomicrobiales bacterium]
SRLKQLVAAGLLSHDAARRPPRAASSLTEAGIQVLPVMVALGAWGRRSSRRRAPGRVRGCATLAIGKIGEAFTLPRPA